MGGGGEMWGNIPIWDSLRREIAKLSGCSVAEIAIVGMRGIWRESKRWLNIGTIEQMNI